MEKLFDISLCFFKKFNFPFHSEILFSFVRLMLVSSSMHPLNKFLILFYHSSRASSLRFHLYFRFIIQILSYTQNSVIFTFFSSLLFIFLFGVLFQFVCSLFFIDLLLQNNLLSRRWYSLATTPRYFVYLTTFPLAIFSLFSDLTPFSTTKVFSWSNLHCLLSALKLLSNFFEWKCFIFPLCGSPVYCLFADLL